MAWLVKKVLSMGAAYLDHVHAVRSTLKLSQAESESALSSYLSGLSDSSFAGFKMTAATMLGRETDSQERIQWIIDNAEALRQGSKTAPVIPKTETKIDAATVIPKAENKTDADIESEELSKQDVYNLISPWHSLSSTEWRPKLHTELGQHSARWRSLLLIHLQSLREFFRQELQSLIDNEANAWGSSYEDRRNYAMAKVTTGSSDPAYRRRIEEGQETVEWVERLIETVSCWRQEPEPMQQPAARNRPALDAAAANDGGENVSNRLMQRMSEKLKANELDEEFFGLLEDNLQSAIAQGLMPLEREFAMREWIEEFRGIAQARNSGKFTPAQSVAEIQRVLARRQELFSTAGHHIVTAQGAANSRARALLPYLQELKTFAFAEAMAFRGSMTQEAEGKLAARVSRAVKHLSTLKDDAAVVAFERNELRELALATHEVALSSHLTLARPIWDCPIQHAIPNRVFFAGAEDARRLLADLCEQKRLDLDVEVQKQNYGQSRWDALRRSAIAVFDWRAYDPKLAEQNPRAARELAAVAYEYGLSIALGKPVVILAMAGKDLPFDLDIEPVQLAHGDEGADRVALASAIDAALYSRQRHATESGLMATADWLRTALAGHPEHSLFEGMEWFDPQHAADPEDFRAIVGQILLRWGEGAPTALFPVWRAAYPTTDPDASKRLFHVMPFSQSWSNAVAKAVEGTCEKVGLVYERGDRSADDRILRRVWEGICTADFVLVDMTGLNPNVMMELGMAHALGRNTLMVARKQEGGGRVRNLAKIEIDEYADHRRLRALVGKWLKEQD